MKSDSNGGHLAIKQYDISIEMAQKISFNFQYKYLIIETETNEILYEKLNKNNYNENRDIDLTKLKESQGNFHFFSLKLT